MLGYWFVCGCIMVSLLVKALFECLYFQDQEAARRTVRDCIVGCVSVLLAAAFATLLNHLG